MPDPGPSPATFIKRFLEKEHGQVASQDQEEKELDKAQERQEIVFIDPDQDEKRLTVLRETMSELRQSLMATEGMYTDYSPTPPFLISDEKQRGDVKQAIRDCARAISGILTPVGSIVYPGNNLNTNRHE